MGNTNYPDGISIGGHVVATDAEFTIGAEAANEINVAVQLVDPGGQPLEAPTGITAYLSDTADGLTPTAATVDTVAIGTNGSLIDITAATSFVIVSDADGQFDLDIGEAGAGTWYLTLILPSGAIVVSDAITFAA